MTERAEMESGMTQDLVPVCVNRISTSTNADDLLARYKIACEQIIRKFELHLGRG